MLDIFYINGVLVKKNEAKSTSSNFYDNFIKDSESHYDQKSKIDVTLIHNESNGVMNDVLELYNQAKRTSGVGPRDYEDFYKEKAHQEILNTTYGGDLGLERSNMAEVEKTLKLISTMDPYKDVTDTENKKVIMVTHSQGNSVLNSAYSELINSQSEFQSEENYQRFKKIFGSLHVASPSTGYLTTDKSMGIKLDKDLIIWGAGVFVLDPAFQPVAPNYEFIGRKSDDKKPSIPILSWIIESVLNIFDTVAFHGFEDTYMNPDIKARKIGSVGAPDQTMPEILTENLTAVAESLESNCGTPSIQITSTEATQDIKNYDTFNIDGYARRDRSITLKVKDIANYADNDKTTFTWDVSTYDETDTNSDILKRFKYVRSEGDEATLEVPFRGVNYSVTVTAVNANNIVSVVTKKFRVLANKAPVAELISTQCQLTPEGYIYDRIMNVKVLLKDDDISMINDAEYNFNLPPKATEYFSRSDGQKTSNVLTIVNTCEYQIPPPTVIGFAYLCNCYSRDTTDDPPKQERLNTGLVLDTKLRVSGYGLIRVGNEYQGINFSPYTAIFSGGGYMSEEGGSIEISNQAGQTSLYNMPAGICSKDSTCGSSASYDNF